MICTELTIHYLCLPCGDEICKDGLDRTQELKWQYLIWPVYCESLGAMGAFKSKIIQESRSCLVVMSSRVMWHDDHHVTSPSSMRRGAAELSEDMERSRMLVRPASPVGVTVRHPPLGWPSWSM